MKAWALLLLAALLFFTCLASVAAEDAGKKEAADANVAKGADTGAADADGDDDDDDDDDDEEDEGLPSSPDVLHAFVFAGSAEKRFLLGDTIDLVLGFRNAGSKNFNVTEIFTSLRWPMDYNIYVQNFTRRSPNFVVKPGEEVSFAYVFTPDPALEPREWGLVTEIFYTDEDHINYSTPFVNTTFVLYESDASLDAQTFFTYIFTIAVASMLVFFGYKFNQSRSRTKRTPTPARSTERGTVAAVADADNDWLAGTAADPNKKGNESWLQKRSRST